MDVKAVIIFLSPDESQVNINTEQQTLLAMQSQSDFARTVLLNPAEDLWNYS